MTDDVTGEVLAAEERRCAAIAAQDWAALDAILADEFTYTHSTGTTEDKSTWTAGIRERRRAGEHDRREGRGAAVRPLGLPLHRAVPRRLALRLGARRAAGLGARPPGVADRRPA